MVDYVQFVLEKKNLILLRYGDQSPPVGHTGLHACGIGTARNVEINRNVVQTSFHFIFIFLLAT